MSSNKYIGYIQLAAAQCMIGANIVIAKALFHQIPLFSLLFLRFIIGSLILFILAKMYKLNVFTNKLGNKLNSKDWIVLILQSLCAGFLFNFFLLLGLHYSNAMAAGIITSIIPVIIALLSFIFLREKLGSRRIIAILLSTIGLIALTMGKGGSQNFLDGRLYGYILLLIAVFPEALFTIIAKWYKANLDPIILSLLVNIINTILFLPFGLVSLFTHTINFNLMNSFLIFLYGLLGGALSFICWYAGLQKCTASAAALFTALVPISTIILAYIALHETINVYEIVAGVFVILAIVLGSITFTSQQKISDFIPKVDNVKFS